MYVNFAKLAKFARPFISFICCFVMADSNFDNGFEKVPAAGEFVGGASAGGLHVEELRGPSAMSSGESSQTSKTEKTSCK